MPPAATLPLGMPAAVTLGLAFGLGPCLLCGLSTLGPVFLVNRVGVRRSWTVLLPYSAGRLTAYATLGLLCGLAGRQIGTHLDGAVIGTVVRRRDDAARLRPAANIGTPGLRPRLPRRPDLRLARIVARRTLPHGRRPRALALCSAGGRAGRGGHLRQRRLRPRARARPSASAPSRPPLYFTASVRPISGSVCRSSWAPGSAACAGSAPACSSSPASFSCSTGWPDISALRLRPQSKWRASLPASRGFMARQEPRPPKKSSQIWTIRTDISIPRMTPSCSCLPETRRPRRAISLKNATRASRLHGISGASESGSEWIPPQLRI